MKNKNNIKKSIQILRIIIFLFNVVLVKLARGQNLSCKELALKIRENSLTSIRYNDSIPIDSFYFIGKYYAQADIDKKILLKHEYGKIESTNPCQVCRYNTYGFCFYYHEYPRMENISNFILGYNEISLAYLKSKIGDSAFAHLDDISKDYFSPREILMDAFNTNGSDPRLNAIELQRYFKVEIINDSTINVKIEVDSLFIRYTQYVTKFVYHISDVALRNNKPEIISILDYKEIKENGFILRRTDKKYMFKIDFDFNGMEGEESYCWCDLMNSSRHVYYIPVKIKN